MKQLVFEFLRNESREIPVPLDEATQKELVELMAAAIAAVRTEQVEEGNDPWSRREQGHGEAPGA